ncbi:MAG: hypothetical protein ACOCQC_03585 [Halanaerobiaceae bacterium]
MQNSERIQHALEETEVLYEPQELISTSEKTTLHYYVLAEPVYLEVYENEGPETKIREGEITWDRPKLLTPGYMLEMDGFSEDARRAFELLARENPDMAGLMYKMRYRKETKNTMTVSSDIEGASEKILGNMLEKEGRLNVIIKGLDELWDVSLMKFVQGLVVKSAYKSQMPHYTERGYLTVDENGSPVVTRNLEGLPLAAREEIEEMFARVKKGEIEPVKLKKELDRWGVYRAYEDRFLNLFRKE